MPAVDADEMPNPVMSAVMPEPPAAHRAYKRAPVTCYSGFFCRP